MMRPVIWLTAFSAIVAAICAIFDINLAAGVLIGTLIALCSFGLTARVFAKSASNAKAVKFRLFVLTPAKIAVVLIGLLLAARLSTSAVAGLFIGVATSLAGFVTASLVGKD